MFHMAFRGMTTTLVTVRTAVKVYQSGLRTTTTDLDVVFLPVHAANLSMAEPPVETAHRSWQEKLAFVVQGV